MILCYYKNRFAGPFPSALTETEMDSIKQFIDSHLDLIPETPNAIDNAEYNDFLQ